RQAGLAREEDAGDDVGCTRATHDQPRSAVDHRVEDCACLVVTVVTRLDEVAHEAAADDRDGGLVEDRACHDASYEVVAGARSVILPLRATRTKQGAVPPDTRPSSTSTRRPRPTGGC